MNLWRRYWEAHHGKPFPTNITVLGRDAAEDEAYVRWYWEVGVMSGRFGAIANPLVLTARRTRTAYRLFIARSGDVTEEKQLSQEEGTVGSFHAG